jgi:RNA polymerase sigma factor for flagellar operon FliA
MMKELIESHLGYAHAIAADLAGKYPPNITRADLEGAAEFGLVQAARSYDPSKCVSFSTFAYYRIRGAIFDEVRKSWRSSHLKDGSDKSVPGEFAETSPLRETYPSWEESENYTSSSGGTYLISLDSSHAERVAAATESPASRVLREEEAESIQAAMRQLPKRYRFVLHAHYYEDLSLVSIGRRLNLSKSWVSRIHAQALVMVRKILQDPGDLRSTEADPIPSRKRRNPSASNLCLQVAITQAAITQVVDNRDTMDPVVNKLATTLPDSSSSEVGGQPGKAGASKFGKLSSQLKDKAGSEASPGEPTSPANSPVASHEATNQVHKTLAAGQHHLARLRECVAPTPGAESQSLQSRLTSIEHQYTRLDSAVKAMPPNASPQQWIALQQQVYSMNENIGVLAKMVGQAASGVKSVLQTQV